MNLQLSVSHDKEFHASIDSLVYDFKTQYYSAIQDWLINCYRLGIKKPILRNEFGYNVEYDI